MPDLVDEFLRTLDPSNSCGRCPLRPPPPVSEVSGSATVPCRDAFFDPVSNSFKCPPSSVSGSASVPCRDAFFDPVTNSMKCPEKSQPCGGGTDDFNGYTSTWTGSVVNGICVKDPSTEVSTYTATRPPDPFTCGVKVCGGAIVLPPDYCYSGQGDDGGTVRKPDGTTMSHDSYCDSSPDAQVCVYSGTVEHLGMDLGNLLVEFGLPRIPSLDYHICDYQKEAAISEVIRLLEGISAGQNVSTLVDDYGVQVPDWLETIENAVGYGDPIMTELFGNYAEYALAAIQFGRLDFSETVENTLKGIPGFGNYLADALGMVGFFDLVDLIVDAIDTGRKERIRKHVVQALDKASLIPVYGILPALALIGILFGMKEWDEMVYQCFSTLKLVKFTGKAGKILTPFFKGVSNALKQVTSVI